MLIEVDEKNGKESFKIDNQRIVDLKKRRCYHLRNLKDRLLINTNYQETRPSEITHPLVDPASTHAIPMQISFFFFLSKSRISQLVKMYENEKSMILSTLMLPSKNTRVAEASMFIVVYRNVF